MNLIQSIILSEGNMVNPDPYGYNYYDDSNLGKSNRLNKFKKMSVASTLYNSVAEAFPKGFTNKVHKGILSIARKTLLDKLDIDIDKTKFTKVDPTTLAYRTKEFRNPRVTFIAKIDQGINHMVIIINNGKILNTENSKLIGDVDNQSWKSFFSKCTELYKAEGPVSYKGSRMAREIMKDFYGDKKNRW